MTRPRPRVLAVGGTSHAGKTSVGRYLATSLTWAHVPTDRLAKHPGRPWGALPGVDPPAHVVSHYESHTPSDLTDLLLTHFASMRDVVTDAVLTSLRSSPGVVIEGSALWAGVNIAPGIPAFSRWLIIDPDQLWQRLQAESQYSKQPSPAQVRIEAFRDRSIAYQERLVNALHASGLEHSAICLTGIESTRDIADLFISDFTRRTSPDDGDTVDQW